MNRETVFLNQTIKKHFFYPLFRIINQKPVASLFLCLSLGELCNRRNLGHIASVALPRVVGRQQLHGGRAASADVPVVPHVRAVHAVGLDPGPGLLCTPSRIPCPVPLGRQGPRLGRGLPPQRYFSTRSNFSLSSHGQCCPGPSTDLTNHVLCLGCATPKPLLILIFSH